VNLYYQSIFELLYISTIAGLATTAGCLIILKLGNPTERVLSILLAGAGGVMLAITVLDLIPASLSLKQPIQFITGYTAGILFIAIADRILHATQKQIPTNRRNKLKRLGILIASGIAIHDIPEGMVIAVGQEATGNIGMLIAIGIALHNLPEGMATTTPLIMAGINKTKILFLNLGIAIFTPIGAILGFFAMEKANASLAFFLALAGGAMSCLVFAQLWPLARENNPRFALIGGTSGFIIFFFISTFLPHI